MALVEFEDLLPELLSAAPSCPLPTMIRSIRNAARELCEKAFCYRVTVESEPVDSGDAEVLLLVPEQTVLVKVISLTLNGQNLDPTSASLLDEDDPEWRTRTGTPCKYIRSDDRLNAIILYPIPDATYTTTGVSGQVAVKPSRDADSIEEMFLERYQSAIVDGALAAILPVKGAPWYDPVVANSHRGLFYNAIEDARSVGNGDDMPKRRTSVYNDYGGSRRPSRADRYTL